MQRWMEGDIRNQGGNEPTSWRGWLKENYGVVLLNVFAFLFGKFVNALYPKDRRR